MKTLKFAAGILASVAILGACKDNDSTNSPSEINAGNDPNFKIVAHSDQGYTATNRKVEVFGIPIYAYSDVEDAKLLHAANVMAQYLDNDEDGTVDNPDLLNKMKEKKAALFMWKKESQINIHAQDLGADETNPAWHTSKSGRFDASLEEIWHVITHSGYSVLYPEALGEDAGSELTNAMDVARGGHFTTIPNEYPKSAWYTYDDKTCDYTCMATEYFYWAMTSVLGAQSERTDEISQEWKLNTKELVQTRDTGVYKVLTNPKYKFPTVLPDGTYKR